MWKCPTLKLTWTNRNLNAGTTVFFCFLSFTAWLCIFSLLNILMNFKGRRTVVVFFHQQFDKCIKTTASKWIWIQAIVVIIISNLSIKCSTHRIFREVRRKKPTRENKIKITVIEVGDCKLEGRLLN